VSTPAELYPLLERFKQRFFCAVSMKWCISGAWYTDPRRQGGESAAQTIEKGRSWQETTAGGAKQGAGGKIPVCSPYRH
jgi:hypothetical protein